MTLLERMNLLNSWANEARILLASVEGGIDDRTISTYDKTAHGGIGYVVVSLRTVLYDVIDALQWFVYGNSYSTDYYHWYRVHKGLYDMEPDITWQAIVEAWVKDDFAGRALTIATIDRMRQILWDEPFYAVWAARPEEQEF